MHNKPLILDFQETLLENTNTQLYFYDHTELLNVIEKNGERIPLVDLEVPTVDYATKTRIIREQDDQNNLFEFSTKTKVRSEADDYFSPLLEFTTKTFVKQESDDQKDINHN